MKYYDPEKIHLKNLTLIHVLSPFECENLVSGMPYVRKYSWIASPAPGRLGGFYSYSI
jgi:hypothetical protein